MSNEEHTQELKRFLDFFKLKKEEFSKDLQLDFKDFLEDNLEESQIYNKYEITNLMQNYHNQVQNQLKNDISKMNYMAAVYLQIIMSQAEEKKLLLGANLNLIEDIKQMEKMKELEQQKFMSKQADQLTKNMAKNLPGLFKKQGSSQNEVNELMEEIEKLKQEKSQIGSNQNEHAIDDLTKQLDKLQNEYNEVHEDNQKKLNESTQVNNLKKMLQKKNDEIKQLKQKLSQYEK